MTDYSLWVISSCIQKPGWLKPRIPASASEAGKKEGAVGPKSYVRAEGCNHGFKTWLRPGVLEGTS